MTAKKQKLYEIDAEYPELSGAANPNAAKFNTLAKQQVTKTVAEYIIVLLVHTAVDL